MKDKANHINSAQRGISSLRGIVKVEGKQDFRSIRNQLMSELIKGRKSGEEKGWLSHEDVKAHFEGKNDEQ